MSVAMGTRRTLPLLSWTRLPSTCVCGVGILEPNVVSTSTSLLSVTVTLWACLQLAKPG